jgi:hypothetical protein
LSVDRTTGGTQLVNTSDFSADPIAFDFYQIQSAAGALNPNSWFSLSNQGFSGWDEIGAASETIIAEANLTSSTTLSSGQSLSLGNAFSSFAGIEDLEFGYGLAGGSQLIAGAVQYVGEPFPPLALPGDYNLDGIVSHADYSVLGDSFGSVGFLPADGDGDGVVGLGDYQFYRAHFGEVALFSAAGDVSVQSEFPLAVVPTTTPEGNTQWTVTVEGVPNSLAGHLNFASSRSNFLSATGGASLLDDGSPPPGVPGRTASGAIAEGIFYETRQAFAALGSTLGASSPGPNRQFVTLVTEGDEFTTLAISGEFGYQGVTYSVNDSFSFGPGSSPSGPLLPDTIAPGEFIFEDVPSGTWVDPPLVDSFEYVMDSASLFTAILDFPPGFAAEFAVTAENTLLGEFGPGDSVNFVTLLGHGVESFVVSNITPLVDAEDSAAFPLKLAFNTSVASFRMLSVPEPGTMFLALMGLSGVLARRR